MVHAAFETLGDLLALSVTAGNEQERTRYQNWRSEYRKPPAGRRNWRSSTEAIPAKRGATGRQIFVRIGSGEALNAIHGLILLPRRGWSNAP